jgi:hypothetical protein
MGFRRQDLQEAFFVLGTHAFGAPGFQSFPLRTDYQSRSWEPGKPPRPARSGAWLRHGRPARGGAAARPLRGGAQPAAPGRVDLRQRPPRRPRWPGAGSSDRNPRGAGDGERKRPRRAGRGASGAGLRRARLAYALVFHRHPHKVPSVGSDPLAPLRRAQSHHRHHPPTVRQLAVLAHPLVPTGSSSPSSSSKPRRSSWIVGSLFHAIELLLFQLEPRSVPLRKATSGELGRVEGDQCRNRDQL